MLIVVDIPDADAAGLLDLAAELQSVAIYDDRRRREAESFDLPEGFRGTAQNVEGMGRRAASIATAARVVGLLAASSRAEERARRSAPVIRLVPREEAAPAPSVHPAALGLLARVRALLGGAPDAKAA